MTSYLWAMLAITSIFLTVVSGAEFHAEHQAVHQTVLEHQHSALWSLAGIHDFIDDDEALLNMSTPIVSYRSEYAGLIGVGTNADGGAQAQVRVVFDTGSTNLWVASTLCHQTPCDSQRALEFYDPQKSTTQKEASILHRNDIAVQFGTGELQGPLHVDTFRVGPFALEKQPFAMIRVMKGKVFQQFPFEGIIGLGFKDMASAGIVPFFDRVIEQKLLTHNEFAFFMNVDSNKPSALLWGGIDKDLYHGQIRMFPVVHPHYWSLELVDFKVGNTSMKGAGLQAPVRRVIVDSGATFLTAPPGMPEEIFKHFPSTDCDKVNDFPPLTYVLKSADNETYDLVVTHETYMIKIGKRCGPGIKPLHVNPEFGPAMMLGEIFMKHFFTVFSRGDGDVKNAKIGFAPANMRANPKAMPAKKTSSFLESQSPKSGSRSITLDSKAQMRTSHHHHNGW